MHAARGAGKTCWSTSGAQTRKCAGARSVRGAEHASTRGVQTRDACKRAEHASTRARSHAVRPAVRSGLSLLARASPTSADRAAVAARPAWLPGAQGVPRAPKGACQALEPSRGARRFKAVGLWSCLLASPGATRRKRMEKRKRQARANAKQLAKRRARRAQAKRRQKQSAREVAELRNHLHQDVPLF